MGFPSSLSAPRTGYLCFSFPGPGGPSHVAGNRIRAHKFILLPEADAPTQRPRLSAWAVTEERTNLNDHPDGLWPRGPYRLGHPLRLPKFWQSWGPEGMGEAGVLARSL